MRPDPGALLPKILPADELHPDKKDEEKPAEKPDEKKDEKAAEKKGTDRAAADQKDDKKPEEKKDEKKPPEVKIDFEDIASRLSEVPTPSGNFAALQSGDKRLRWLNASDARGEHIALQCLDVANKGDEADTVMSDVQGSENRCAMGDSAESPLHFCRHLFVVRVNLPNGTA